MHAKSERPNVLVVDDERAVLDSIEAVLDDHTTVRTTTSPIEALRLLDSARYDVICADYRMPILNGIQLLQRVGERREFVSCLLITGAEEYFRKDERSSFYMLLKPFSPDRLVALVLQLARVAQMKRSVNDLVGAQTGRYRVVKP
jgi:DNA-binding NtrC family response regulator